MQVYSELLPEKVGWPVVPVLVTPDDQWIQDSEDIIHHLEAAFPDKKSSKCIFSLVGNLKSRNQQEMNFEKFYPATRTETEASRGSSPTIRRSTSAIGYYALPLEFSRKS